MLGLMPIISLVFCSVSVSYASVCCDVYCDNRRLVHIVVSFVFKDVVGNVVDVVVNVLVGVVVVGVKVVVDFVIEIEVSVDVVIDVLVNVVLVVGVDVVEIFLDDADVSVCSEDKRTDAD